MYTLEETAITATPYKVASGSSAGVQYRPAAHGHGAPYTQFGYAVYDGQAMSKEALVNVHVTSVNDAPAPVGLSGLSVESTKSLVITLEATDVDLPDDSVTLAASTLPDAGTLYTLNADSTVGVPITAPGTSLVTTVSGQTATAQVVLMPADDLGDLPSHTVSFGFVGMDAAGEVSHEEMVEVEVTQDIVLGQVSTVPDALGTGGFVAGLVGHAIVLDGVAQQVTLPHSDLFEADFTLEVYFKTSAAIHEDIALVTQAGSFFLGWKLFKGLTFVLESAGATGSNSVHTGQTFNDAAWHHVAVTFASSTQQLKIFVDGAMLKAETAEAGFSQVTGSPAQVVLGARGSADGLADNFKGYIDEVRVWGVAKSEAAVAAHRSVKITPGAMKPDLGAGLRVLYTFDGDLQDLCPVAGAACPAAVHLPGPPTFVSSGAPLFMKTLKLGKGWGEGNAMGFYPSAAEGGPDNVGINLLGTDLDYDGLSFEITSLPSHGTVSFAEGDAMTVIDQVPFRMAPGSGAGKPRHHAQVVNTPAPGEYADVAIGYTVWDGLVRSAEALVTIEIEEKNRAPVTGGDVAVTATLDTCGAAVGNDRTAVPTVSYDPALGSTEHKFAPAVWWADSCGGMANIYPVVMEASDADGDAFDVIVTTLPGFGTLYQTADGVTPTLTSEVAPGSVVSYREGGKATLLYSTIDLDAVTDPGTATSFGFKAVDAKGFTSGESTVSVTLAGASADFAIFSGIKGFALMLDGVDDAFDLPAEEIAAGAFHSGFTVGMWVKSTGAILQGSTLFSAVTSAGKGFRASWTHAGGLEVSVELVSEESMARGSAAGKPLSAKAASGKQLNDGQWHFVDIEYDTSTGLNSPMAQVCVRIDDGAGSCTSASELSAKFVPSAMALGKDITSSGGTMFKGMVDELRVYGAALTTALHPEQPGWHSRSGGVYGAASVFMHQALMGTEKDLVAYFRFNDVATLQTDNKVMNLVSDKLVPVAGSPSAMSSTVPIMLKVTTEEDEAILLSLTGVEFSAASLNAVVTKLPELGKLHQVLPSGLAGWQILNGWSISAWFKTSAVVSDYASLVTKGAFLGTMGLGGEWALQWTREGGLGFHICEYCTSSNPQQVIASANSYNLYNDGYWHHVAGTFDPALKTIAIYVDGQLPAGAKSLAPISNLYLEDQGSRITVGRDDKGSEQSIFFGQVDEISVFDYPLNKAEVISLSRHADVAERTSDGPNGGTGKRVTWKLNTPASLAVRAEQGAGEAGTASSVAAFKPSTLSIPTDLSIVGFGVSQVVPLYGADQDGDRLEYLITEVPAKGQLYFTENGALGAQVLRAGVATAAGPLIYVSGEDDEAGAGPYATFKYAVTDGREVSADVEMRIFVFGKNKAPTVALAAPVETLEEAAVTVTLLVADKEGHDVTVAVAGGPTNGHVSTSLITKGEDGSFTFVYTPNPDFYGVDVVTVVATDSQGTSALPFDVLITVKGVNDGPVVTAPPSIEMTFEEMVLPGISVADVDAENAVLTATLTTTVGFLSAVSIADAKASKLLQVTVSGQLEELNDKLGKILIYNEAMVAGTITLTVTDNGGTGLGGPVLVTVEIPVTTKILPILSAHITNNLLGIRAKYRFPSDGLTSVDGDCSAVLMSDTIKRIGPSACALNGQGAGCPVCTFSTPTDLSVIFGTDPTIMPGDSVVFKAGVVSIACGPGDAADGCVTGPQPVMTVVLQPPTERIPPVVTITGPAEVGQCDALSLSAVLTSGFGGRPATATWSLAPPVPSGAATAAGLLYTVAADIPAATYSASVQVVNFLGQVTSQAFAFTKNALPLPTLALEEDTFEVYRSNEVKVVAVAKPSSCEGAGADLTYTWSFLQGPVDDPFFPAGFLAGWIAQQTGSTLLIPKDFLVPTFIEPYVIQVSVADPATPEIAVAATATIAVLAQDLRVIVEGPDRVSVSTPFSLDASRSVDPDLPTSPLNFLWSWPGPWRRGRTPSPSGSPPTRSTTTRGSGSPRTRSR